MRPGASAVAWWWTVTRCSAALATVGFAAWVLSRTMNNQQSNTPTRRQLEQLPPNPSRADLGYPETPGVDSFTTEHGDYMVVYDRDSNDAWIQSSLWYEWASQ